MFDFDLGTLFNLPNAGGGGGGGFGDFFSGFGDFASKAGSGFADAASGLFSGGKDLLGGFGDVAKSVLPVAQVGAAGLGIASGIKGAQQLSEQNKILRRSQQTQERAAAPLAQFGEEELRRAAGGEVSPAIQKEIDLWAAGAKQKARDYLSRSGQGDSSTLAEWESWIDEQAVAMKTGAISDMKRGGVAALQGAAGAASGAAQTAGNQQSSLENLIASANQQLARLSGAAA